MKILLVFISLFAGGISFQKHRPLDMVGVWRVQEVNIDKNSPMATNPSVQSLIRTSMGQMVFALRENHHIQMSGGTQGNVPDGIWTYDAAKSKLQIKSGNGADERIVNILVSRDDKKQVYFKMMDAPVTLRVIKQ